MRMLLLLLAGLCMTLASACTYPFNNARLTNSSLVADYIAELQSNGKLGDDGGKGWMSDMNAATPDRAIWPNYKDTKLVYIEYCFATSQDFTNLHKIVADAAQAWMNKMGSGSKNQHRFNGFRHYWHKGGGYYPRCYTTPPGTDKKIWNSLVPHDTLEIAGSIGGSSAATVGYIDGKFNTEPGRHRMRLGTPVNDHKSWLSVIVHEMGHILGLEHEHQREDRDKYINFDCTKLRGYEVAKEKLENDPRWKGISIKDVCKSNHLGYENDLNWGTPADYSTDMGVDRTGTPYQQSYGKDYDYDSIMHYDSRTDSSMHNDGVRDVNLVRWKNGRPSDGSGPDDSNAELIPYNVEITDGDKKGIQFLYQWQGV